jgi:acetyl esterase/lipase
MVRVLCSKSLDVDFSTGVLKNKNKKTVSFFANKSPTVKKGLEKAVVLHVHGGGFVAMSSGSHQTYTRRWANELAGVPIFSVDYRLAPASIFPAALNDVWQVYLWLCEGHADTYLGVRPEKIVLVGDSAGGNLVAALTLLAI